MLNIEPFRAELDSILKEWNQAERDIKQAEQVCLRVSEPSIKELRYAGRRITEALSKILASSPADSIRKLLNDADFDCHRARHDAIDAATAKMTSDTTTIVDLLGYDLILKHYPDFSKFRNDLLRVRGKIVVSREDRDNRDAIYEVIENVDLVTLVSSFNELMQHEDVMKSAAKKERRSKALVIFFGIVELLVFFVGVTELYLHFTKPGEIVAPPQTHLAAPR